MTLDIPSDASYALCQPPSFNVGADEIALGTIFPETEARPKRPNTTMAINDAQIPRVEKLVTSAESSLTVVVDAFRSTSSGIWAHVDFLPGIGGRLGGGRSQEEVILIQAKDVETKHFRPTRAFTAQALSVDPVKDLLEEFHRPPVYMVTGIKVAARADIFVGTKKTRGVDVGPEFDLSQFCVPINVGADVVHEFSDLNMVRSVRETPFVLAYETRMIKVKANGSHTQKAFNKFAVLDDVATDEDTAGKFLDGLDIRLLTPELEMESDEAIVNAG